MIRFRLREVIAEREFQSGKRITQEEIYLATGIHRTTLSKISGQRGYNTTTDNIDKLCRFLGCKVEDLMQYIPDEEILGTLGQ
jgi:putative transcriptional regulator